jgi:tetratricopeptide (TPR) repeat protein
VRWLKTVTSSAKIALAAGLLAGILSPALAGGSGAAAQLPATAKPAATADREASLKRIERLKRSGKLADARRLMPMLKNPDELVSREAEQAIWLLWGRSGNPGVDRLFRAGVSQIGNDEVERAIETFSRVIDNQPTFAEAWNKRATARFLAGDLIGAMDDCERTLSLVPDHFGSLAGYGHIYFRLNDLDMAILYWQRALEVNPNLHSVARSIGAAEKLLARRGRLRT